MFNVSAKCFNNHYLCEILFLTGSHSAQQPLFKELKFSSLFVSYSVAMVPDLDVYMFTIMHLL